MSALLILLLSHFVGDYAFQTEYMAENKGKDNYILVAHVATWTFIVSTTALFIGVNFPDMIIFLFVPHLIMDYIKARKLLWCKRVTPQQALTIDQSFHLLQILLLWTL